MGITSPGAARTIDVVLDEAFLAGVQEGAVSNPRMSDQIRARLYAGRKAEREERGADA